MAKGRPVEPIADLAAGLTKNECSLTKYAESIGRARQTVKAHMIRKGLVVLSIVVTEATADAIKKDPGPWLDWIEGGE